jgi:hypothetical protein
VGREIKGERVRVYREGSFTNAAVGFPGKGLYYWRAGRAGRAAVEPVISFSDLGAGFAVKRQSNGSRKNKTKPCKGIHCVVRYPCLLSHTHARSPLLGFTNIIAVRAGSTHGGNPKQVFYGC